MLTDGPDADEMTAGLAADMDSLIEAGLLDPSEADDMRSWLGSNPFAA